MLIKVTLALALIAVLAAASASAGPRGGQGATFSYDDSAYNRDGW